MGFGPRYRVEKRRSKQWKHHRQIVLRKPCFYQLCNDAENNGMGLHLGIKIRAQGYLAEDDKSVRALARQGLVDAMSAIQSSENRAENVLEAGNDTEDG